LHTQHRGANFLGKSKKRIEEKRRAKQHLFASYL
jgi:hypothetical protein